MHMMAKYLAILAVAIQASGASAFVGSPALSSLGARSLSVSNSRESRSGLTAFFVRVNHQQCSSRLSVIRGFLLPDYVA
jgi:hypothetical protein